MQSWYILGNIIGSSVKKLSISRPLSSMTFQIWHFCVSPRTESSFSWVAFWRLFASGSSHHWANCSGPCCQNASDCPLLSSASSTGCLSAHDLSPFSEPRYLFLRRESGSLAASPVTWVFVSFAAQCSRRFYLQDWQVMHDHLILFSGSFDDRDWSICHRPKNSHQWHSLGIFPFVCVAALRVVYAGVLSSLRARLRGIKAQHQRPLSACDLFASLLSIVVYHAQYLSTEASHVR